MCNEAEIFEKYWYSGFLLIYYLALNSNQNFLKFSKKNWNKLKNIIQYEKSRKIGEKYEQKMGMLSNRWRKSRKNK